METLTLLKYWQIEDKASRNDSEEEEDSFFDLDLSLQTRKRDHSTNDSKKLYDHMEHKPNKSYVSTPEESTHGRKSFKTEAKDVLISSLFLRSNSSNSSKGFAIEAMRKYMKLIKPLYNKTPKSDKKKLSDDLVLLGTPLSSPIATVRSQVKKTPLREVCKQLRKSRSASSATTERRDDSLRLYNDGIESAILHCRTSYYSCKDSSRRSI